MKRTTSRATWPGGPTLPEAYQVHSVSGGSPPCIRRRIKLKAPRMIVLIVLVALLAAALVSSPAVAGEHFVELGRWSEPFWEGGDQPYDPPSDEKSKKYPTSAALMALPDGRVIYWNALENSEDANLFTGSTHSFTHTIENSRVRLLDIFRPTPFWSTSKHERGTSDVKQDTAGGAAHDLFCSDQKLLYDGRVLAAGGTAWVAPVGPNNPEGGSEVDIQGVRDTRVFDPSTNEFQQVEDMDEPRWYPSLVTLPDGRVLVTSGVRKLISSPTEPSHSFSQVRLSEIYDPAAQEWKNGGTSDWSFPLYPRLHLLPDGEVFYGGAGQAWNPFGESADQALWGFQRTYDPSEKKWTLGDHARYGMRSGAASALLRLEPPYDTADILIAGGALGSAPGNYLGSTLSEIVRWTRGEGISNVGSTKPPLAGVAGDQSQLRNSRWFSVPVVLPTGEVFLVNGGDNDDVVAPGSAAAVRVPELYDPDTDTWRELAPSARDRVYHHTAVLLPDGRVLVGGHAPLPAAMYDHGALPARRNDFKDATFEIYQPPYLFRGDRPAVDQVLATEGGRSLRLQLGENTVASDISEVVLVRLGATTHAMDGDIRAVKLVHQGTGKTVSADLPRDGDGRVLPPGPYYVFAMRETSDGPVPSIAKVVLVQPAGEGKVEVKST